MPTFRVAVGGGEIGSQQKHKPDSNELLDARFSDNHREIPEEQIKILNRLGTGSAGNVFKAKWRGEVCAVKILHAKYGENAQEYKDFLKEIRVLSHLKHQNIVLVLGACTERSGPPYLLYELLKGGSIQDLFAMNKSLNLAWDPNESKVLRWCMDLLAALAFMHKHHLLHRDVKLANILLSSDHTRLKVGDFGLCRIFEGNYVDLSRRPRRGGVGGDGQDGTMTGMTGTYRYMAPEIFAGAKTYTDKVDVFSAALCMWSICTGVRPFDSIPTDQLSRGMVAREGGIRPPLDSIANKELAEAIAKGWVHVPNGRPSCAQLHATLDFMARPSPSCLSFFSGR